MLDPDLISLLRCPATGQSVREMTAPELAEFNIRRGEKPLDAALIREDGALIFPVFDEIPVMLLDEAIPVTSGGHDLG